jgi:pimeloyl-ACP methyl ester carboxylesterase
MRNHALGVVSVVVTLVAVSIAAIAVSPGDHTGPPAPARTAPLPAPLVARSTRPTAAGWGHLCAGPSRPNRRFVPVPLDPLAHDASSVLERVQAPTLVTFGAHDLVTSTRFADPLTNGIADTELVVFDHLSHGALHEDPETFNGATVDFLLRHDG